MNIRLKCAYDLRAGWRLRWPPSCWVVVLVAPVGGSGGHDADVEVYRRRGQLWQGRTVWGKEYVDAAGVKRIVNDAVAFTSADVDATTVDYSIRGYDGAGKVIYATAADDWVFDFVKGTNYLTRNPRNPGSAPGKAKIVVSVGVGNDGHGNCTMTFVQPVGDADPPDPDPRRTPPHAHRPEWVLAERAAGEDLRQSSVLNGPATAPAGAIVVPAGNKASVDLERAGKTYWFAPGVHTLGSGEYSQIGPGDNSTLPRWTGCGFGWAGEEPVCVRGQREQCDDQVFDGSELRGADE